MADYYVDSTSGSDTNDGTTPALAFSTLQHAVGTVANGNNIWVRRGHSETPSADIGGINGSVTALAKIAGWPRASISGTGTFTNGSRTVSGVSISLTRGAHCGRLLTAPDGNIYFIIRVVDSNSFKIDREYAGTTSTGGSFTIDEDDFYADRPSGGQSAWDGDAHTLPVLDFSGTAVHINLRCGNHYQHWACFDIICGTGYAIVVSNGRLKKVTSFLLRGIGNNKYISITRAIYLSKIIIEPTGIPTSGRVGINVEASGVVCKWLSIGNCCNGLYFNNTEGDFNEVSLGLENANTGSDIGVKNCHGLASPIVSRALLDGTNGYVGISYFGNILFPEFGKDQSEHRFYSNYLGDWQTVEAGAGSPIPDQRSGGASKLIQVSPDIDAAAVYENTIFEHYFNDDSSFTVKYYIQTTITAGLTAAELFLRATYEGDSAGGRKTAVSSSTIAVRSGITDWSQYLELAVPAPDHKSPVKVELVVMKYDASNEIWIDPEPVVS